MLFVAVTIPVTPNVDVIFVASSTSSVPSITVLPVAAATVNLVELTSKLPEIDPVPATVKLDPDPTILTVELSVAIPVRPNVPATVVLPVTASTLNLLFATARSSPTSNVPVTFKLPPISASSTTNKSSPTLRSNPIPAPPPTINVPVEGDVALVVSNNLIEPASIPDLVPPNTSDVLVAL